MVDHLEKILAAHVEPHIGTTLEFTYNEWGDDDDGYGWSREGLTKSAVIDGAIIQNGEMYLVGHHYAMFREGIEDVLIAKSFSGYDTSNSSTPDAGEITHCSRFAGLHLLGKGKGNDLFFESRYRDNGNVNYFLTQECLTNNHARIIAPEAKK